MRFYFVIADKYGIEFSFSCHEITLDARTLVSFRIFAGSINYPWFKYRISADHGILCFELGHGKLQSRWIAQGPIKKVA